MWTIIKLYLYQCFIYVSLCIMGFKREDFPWKIPTCCLPMLLIDPHIWWLSPNCPQVSLLKISRNSVKCKWIIVCSRLLDLFEFRFCLW